MQLCIHCKMTSCAGRVSPFGHPRIRVSLQTPRGFSHATTSFIASYCLGIHRMRLFTWPYNPNKSVFSLACRFYIVILKRQASWKQVVIVLYASATLSLFFCLSTYSCVRQFSQLAYSVLCANYLTRLTLFTGCFIVSSLELVVQSYPFTW